MEDIPAVPEIMEVPLLTILVTDQVIRVPRQDQVSGRVSLLVECWDLSFALVLLLITERHLTDRTAPTGQVLRIDLLRLHNLLHELPLVSLLLEDVELFVDKLLSCGDRQ